MARTGEQYIDGLKDTRSVWLGNEKVSVTEHPVLAGSIKGMSGYFDWQHRFADNCLVDNPDVGAITNACLLIPRGKEDLQKRHRSFDKLAAAKTWVAQTEGDIERCLYLDTSGLERLAVSELLDRYEKEVLPTHRGGQVEAYRIRHLQRYLGNLRLIHLTPKVLAEYRDTRLLSITPASLKCEFTILNRVLNIAIKDWGIALPQNPVQMISLPKADKRREFLRARRNAEGGLDLFGNQSSGVLTSAHWADGLIDLPAGQTIAEGDVVRFIPLAELLA